MSARRRASPMAHRPSSGPARRHDEPQPPTRARLPTPRRRLAHNRPPDTSQPPPYGTPAPGDTSPQLRPMPLANTAIEHEQTKCTGVRALCDRCVEGDVSEVPRPRRATHDREGRHRMRGMAGELEVHLRKNVFVAGSTPRITYNPRGERHLEPEVGAYLDQGFGRALSVSSPTKSGKTVLVERALPRDEAIWVEGPDLTSVDVFWD